MLRYGSWAILFLGLSGAPLQAAEPERPVTALGELFACRFEKSVELFKTVTAREPANGDAWYGLVRAEIEAHHSKEAYDAADAGLQSAPETAGAQCAAGLAMYRRGDIPKAEQYFRAALKIDSEYSGALRGLSRVYLSMRRTAHDLMLKAWRNSPDDPDLALALANTLTGAQHLAALESLLAKIDPASDYAKNLRSHIATDKALSNLKLRVLASPYESSRVKLVQLMNGPSRVRGFGLTAVLNQKQKVTLLLDTGASGIALSPKAAEKAGLSFAGSESADAKGIGDERAQPSFRYLAQQLRVGDVIFNNYPVSVFRSARSDEADGLIGADVFQRFIVSLDFQHDLLTLDPRQSELPESGGPVDAAKIPPPGFHRVFRFGNHMGVPTVVNEKHNALFLIDSGSSSNLIDSDLARASTGVYGDSRTVVQGVQGKVAQTSRASRISLVFAGFRQENPDLVAISLEKMGDSMGCGFGGIIGMPVLRSMRLTIDYQQGVVRFDYRP